MVAHISCAWVVTTGIELMSNKKKRSVSMSAQPSGNRSRRRSSNARKRLVWLAVLAVGLALLVVPSVVAALGK